MTLLCFSHPPLYIYILPYRRLPCQHPQSGHRHRRGLLQRCPLSGHVHRNRQRAAQRERHQSEVSGGRGAGRGVRVCVCLCVYMCVHVFLLDLLAFGCLWVLMGIRTLSHSQPNLALASTTFAHNHIPYLHNPNTKKSPILLPLPCTNNTLTLYTTTPLHSTLQVHGKSHHLHRHP